MSGDNFTTINENGKKKVIKYREIFDSISPGLYKAYIGLSKHSHGNFSAIKFKTVYKEGILYTDPGLVFKNQEAKYIMFQYSVYLLAHLKFLMNIFPEIKTNMSIEYEKIYNETIEKLWEVLDFSNKENSEWYKASIQLIDNI